MLDIGWTELVVIAIVLIIVVGPKDLPPMLRAFGRMTSKMRGMASDFRRQFDEALREADLDEVRKTISDAQSLNPTAALRDAMNPLRQLGNEIKSDLQRAATPDKPAQPAVPEAVTEPAAEAPAKPAETVAAAAIGSAARQVDRATAERLAAETRPAGVSEPEPPRKPAKAATATKKARATTRKAPARKADVAAADPTEAKTAEPTEAKTKKTRAASRKKGDA